MVERDGTGLETDAGGGEGLHAESGTEEAPVGLITFEGGGFLAVEVKVLIDGGSEDRARHAGDVFVGMKDVGHRVGIKGRAWLGAFVENGLRAIRVDEPGGRAQQAVAEESAQVGKTGGTRAGGKERGGFRVSLPENVDHEGEDDLALGGNCIVDLLKVGGSGDGSGEGLVGGDRVLETIKCEGVEGVAEEGFGVCGGGLEELVEGKVGGELGGAGEEFWGGVAGRGDGVARQVDKMTEAALNLGQEFGGGREGRNGAGSAGREGNGGRRRAHDGKGHSNESPCSRE